MRIALRSHGYIFHSDRPSHALQAKRCQATGSQYCSHDDQKILHEHGFKASMSGNCYDRATGPIGSSPMARAAVETFFKTIKAELIWRRSWEARRQAKAAIFQYINGFYNARRRQSKLGGKSPLAFECQVA
jgi:transposase InsO family protein